MERRAYIHTFFYEAGSQCEGSCPLASLGAISVDSSVVTGAMQVLDGSHGKIVAREEGGVEKILEKALLLGASIQYVEAQRNCWKSCPEKRPLWKRVGVKMVRARS